MSTQHQYNSFNQLVSQTYQIGSDTFTESYTYNIDNDSGFYYLQSRYYDPAICRFINADSYASTGQGFVGNNMFACCMNSPVSLSDASGYQCVDRVRQDIQDTICFRLYPELGVSVHSRLVGAGAQFSVNVGNSTYGLEVIVYWDDTVCEANNGEPICAVYVYDGAFIDYMSLTNDESFVKAVEGITCAVKGMIVQGGKRDLEFAALQACLTGSVDFSASAVLVYGYENFCTPADYEGSFMTTSISAQHVVVGYAYSNKSWTLTAGATTQAHFGLSFGGTDYVQLI